MEKRRKTTIKLNENVDLNESLYSLETSVRKKTNRIDTVCSSCSTPDRYNVAESNYTVCHSNCKCVTATKVNQTIGCLIIIQFETCQEAKLQQCSCIDKKTLTCKSCQCLWSVHMQIDYELVNEKVGIDFRL